MDARLAVNQLVRYGDKIDRFTDNQKLQLGAEAFLWHDCHSYFIIREISN